MLTFGTYSPSISLFLSLNNWKTLIYENLRFKKTRVLVSFRSSNHGPVTFRSCGTFFQLSGDWKFAICPLFENGPTNNCFSYIVVFPNLRGSFWDTLSHFLVLLGWKNVKFNFYKKMLSGRFETTAKKHFFYRNWILHFFQ